MRRAGAPVIRTTHRHGSVPQAIPGQRRSFHLLSDPYRLCDTSSTLQHRQLQGHVRAAYHGSAAAVLSCAASTRALGTHGHLPLTLAIQRHRAQQGAHGLRLQQRRWKVTYRVALRTADERGAGIYANAVFIVRGTEGKHATVLRPAGGRFERGVEETFEFDLEDSLGEISTLSITPDTPPEYNGWLLERVRVEEWQDARQTREIEFTCNQWLGSTFEGLSTPKGVTLHASTHDPRMKIESALPSPLSTAEGNAVNGTDTHRQGSWSDHARRSSSTDTNHSGSMDPGNDSVAGLSHANTCPTPGSGGDDIGNGCSMASRQPNAQAAIPAGSGNDQNDGGSSALDQDRGACTVAGTSQHAAEVSEQQLLQLEHHCESGLPGEKHGGGGGGSGDSAPVATLPCPITIKHTAAALPHSHKVRNGTRAVCTRTDGVAGEDAYAVREQDGFTMVAVADGVHAWADHGIDSGEMAQALVRECARVFKEEVDAYGEGMAEEEVCQGKAGPTCAAAVPPAFPDPESILEKAWSTVQASGVRGSSTITLLVIEHSTGHLKAVTLGDSPFIVIRPHSSNASSQPDGSGGSQHGSIGTSYHGAASIGSIIGGAHASPEAMYYRSMVVGKARIVEHFFGKPYQLGHHEASDQPADAVVQDMQLLPGDMVVCGTDGVFDNVHDYEIARVVSSQKNPWTAAVPLLTLAFDASNDKERLSPWAEVANEELGMFYSGGKPDDMTAVVLSIR